MMYMIYFRWAADPSHSRYQWQTVEGNGRRGWGITAGYRIECFQTKGTSFKLWWLVRLAQSTVMVAGTPCLVWSYGGGWSISWQNFIEQCRLTSQIPVSKEGTQSRPGCIQSLVHEGLYHVPGVSLVQCRRDSIIAQVYLKSSAGGTLSCPRCIQCLVQEGLYHVSGCPVPSAEIQPCHGCIHRLRTHR